MAQTEIRMFGPALIPAGVTTHYTVPALSKVVLRHLHISNPTAAVHDFTMSVGADAQATRIFQNYPIPAGGVFDWYPLLTLEAAEIIQMNASLFNTMTVVADGTLYTLG